MSSRSSLSSFSTRIRRVQRRRDIATLRKKKTRILFSHTFVLYRELSHVRRALVTVERFHAVAVTREDGRKKGRRKETYVDTSPFRVDFVREFGRRKAAFDDDERAGAKTDLRAGTRLLIGPCVPIAVSISLGTSVLLQLPTPATLFLVVQ